MLKIMCSFQILWVGFICLQCWFFEIIYRWVMATEGPRRIALPMKVNDQSHRILSFYQFLEDRESSFCFAMEPEYRTSSINNAM